MLRLVGTQMETLFDEALPTEARELPEDLGRLDALLADPALLEPVERAWEQTARDHGRPTIPIAVYLRLMVVKQRTGWGYETLAKEVSDSLHLRRFCLIALSERVPSESTVRKLTRRLGPEVVAEITRAVIGKAKHERRFTARAARCDSTVVEADVRYPSDAALAVDATRLLAREARRAGVIVRDRSRAAAKRLRMINRTVGRRIGQAKPTVLRLTGEAGELVRRSVRETRRRAAELRQHARGRDAQAKISSSERLTALAERADKVAAQIDKRLAGERIADRLVSLADPDARPIRKGKLGRPNEFGYVFQLCELTPNTRRGARGLILPPASAIGAPNECELLPDTAAELGRVGLKPREFALDGGFEPGPTNSTLAATATISISGRQRPPSPRTAKRLARYRVGAEGRISHLKRSYGLARTRLRGHAGAKTWVGWSVLAYNLDTLAVQPA